MSLTRYKVTVRRTQTQTVEFTCDTADFPDGQGRATQIALAASYCHPDRWDDQGFEIMNLTSLEVTR